MRKTAASVLIHVTEEDDGCYTAEIYDKPIGPDDDFVEIDESEVDVDVIVCADDCYVSYLESMDTEVTKEFSAEKIYEVAENEYLIEYI